MIEFKMKPFRPGFVVADWEELCHLNDRTFLDFEFSYCDYKFGDEIFTEMCPGFLDAFKKEKFWMKLKQ